MPQLCSVRGVKNNWIKIEKFCLLSGRPWAQIRGNWRIALNKYLFFSVVIFVPRNSLLLCTEGEVLSWHWQDPLCPLWCPCNIKLGLAETNNPGFLFLVNKLTGLNGCDSKGDIHPAGNIVRKTQVCFDLVSWFRANLGRKISDWPESQESSLRKYAGSFNTWIEWECFQINLTGVLCTAGWWSQARNSLTADKLGLQTPSVGTSQTLRSATPVSPLPFCPQLAPCSTNVFLTHFCETLQWKSYPNITRPPQKRVVIGWQYLELEGIH